MALNDKEPAEDKESRGANLLRYVRDWTLSIAVAVLVFLAIGYLRPKPTLPDQAPDFSLTTLDGEAVQLSSLRGKTVVLNFWADWCGPCRQEIPAFSEFARENPDIPVLGVAVDSNEKRVTAMREELNIPYPLLMADRAVSSSYDIDTLPTTVIVAPDGGVKTVHVGMMMGWQLEMATR